ncbi:hypothetical protein WJX81_007252 [Elliptochloris bilobata]|uniref:Glycosyltransferase family 92 protein n=1 Tax=Elliptochloris bilobata TaxID=381761 RepID=A0AAW1RM70_9CHLO
MSDLVANGKVVYTFFAQHPQKYYARAQLYVYSKCLADHALQHRWMAFMDADEFFVLKDGTPDLPALLRDYEDFGGLAVNWQLFGSSGHLTRPLNSTVRAYTACVPVDADENRHVKTIASLQHVLRPIDPHHFSYKAGKFAVNTDSLPVRGPLAAHAVNSRLVINHYVTKSLEEFHAKTRRGSAMSNKKTIHFFQSIEAQATEFCPPPAEPLGASR